MAETKGRKAKTTDKRTERISKAELVSRVLEKMEKTMVAEGVKPTVGDFIRLVQLEKELAEEQPKEIKVSWVEPEKTSEKDDASAK